MSASLKLILLAGMAGLVSGCMSDDLRRADGITYGAGDRIAANTVMQMVDPWQEGVQDTRLRVPADRGGSSAQAADSATQTMTSSN